MSSTPQTIADWQNPSASTWISAPIQGGPRTVPPATYFRRSFSLEKKPQSAILHITALGIFECEINGQRIGDEVFSPGWTEYRVRAYYRSYDVTKFLKEGENVIGVIVGDGWYSGHIAEKNRQYYGESPALLACLEDHSTATPSVLVQTDSQWKRSIGPIVANDLLMGESYDARRELGDWSAPGYCDAEWLPVVTPNAPKITIERSPGPPVTRHETLPGNLIIKPDEPSWKPALKIYDFNQNLTGRVRIRVSGKCGTHIKIRHAEILDANGSLYTENLRSAIATDHYTLKGEGIETYEPRFTFHGFRYVEFTWQDSWQGGRNEFTIESVEAIVLHSDMSRTGTFECSNPLLNQLAKNTLWGQKGNFLEVPTDCPQRDERLGWTGDAQVFIRTAAFFMDVRGFFHKWLKDMRDAQGADGAVPPIVPFTGSFGLVHDGGPAWADAALICPWTIYLCYGDKEILADSYSSMVAYFDYLSKNKVKDDIRAHPEVDEWGGFGDWLALDGGGKTDGITPKDLIGTAFYANNAFILANTADILGKTEEAQHFRKRHAEITAAFQRRFVTADGLLTSGTQTAYILALHFDLLPEALRPVAAQKLVKIIEGNGWHIGTGFVGTPYILHVLEKQGHLDVAYKLLEQESFPSWLFPVKNGATTIWERWDGWHPVKGFQDKGMNSFNHYAYGAVVDWMVSSVAGLQFDPADPGYRHIIFKPRPGGTLTHAKADLHTPYGKSSIAWKIENSKLMLDLIIPEGATATLDLPADLKISPVSLTPGNHQLSYSL